MSILKTITGLLIAATLTACGGGGGEARTPVAAPATSTAAATVSSILLTAPSPLTLSADGTAKAVKVRALDSSGGLVKGAIIGIAATGSIILDASSVTTDATTGLATVNISADTSNQSSRTATITASCVSCTASSVQLSIAVTGATVSISSSAGNTLTVGGGSPSTVTVLLKDAFGGSIPAGVPVVFSSSDTTILAVGATTVNTIAGGKAIVTVAGGVAGNANILVNVPSLNVQSSINFDVVTVGSTITIQSPLTNATMVTNVPQAITVSAPGASSFSFSSTLGSFSTTTINGSVGTSNLTVSQAGSATVTVVDNLSRTYSITLRVSPPAPTLILLNANQTTIGLATDTSVPSIRLTATALYSSGKSQQPVANVPILFTMSGGPGAGEYLSTAYKLTDSAGNAEAIFYSGKRVSIQNGISVSAQVQGTAIQTGTGSNGPDAKLTIGGTALSVALGSANVIKESTDKTFYILDHSVQVTDANNNPVAGQLVTLRLRPVAFSLGSNCSIPLTTPHVNGVADIPATYCSEDDNGNGSLEAATEDGVRKLTTVQTVGQCKVLPTGTAGTSDGLLTPQNSVGGSVPATVTTDANGIASFSLTYLKASAIWLIDQLTATVSVSGTESSTSTTFQLPATVPDTTPISTLPPSPFAY